MEAGRGGVGWGGEHTELQRQRGTEGGMWIAVMHPGRCKLRGRHVDCRGSRGRSKHRGSSSIVCGSEQRRGRSSSQSDAKDVSPHN